MKNKKLFYFLWLNLIVVNDSWGKGGAFPNPIEKQPNNTTTQRISPEESQSRLEDARLLFERGKSDAAIFMLQALSKVDPDNYQVLLELGRIAVGAKNWAYSIQVFRQASLMRPKDIEVRMILMDVYKAYQMPIQEIIVCKEVVALDKNHILAHQRLAELYYEQAMLEDEIIVRQKLKRLTPHDYTNLKKLAVLFDSNAQLWESAKVYEKIRQHHPNKLDDMRRLAAIYDKLGESFREAEVLDHIKAQGGGGSWMESHAEQVLRRQNNIHDPFAAEATFKVEKEPNMKTYSVQQKTSYTRIRVRSSVDFGITAQYTHLNYNGRGQLNGNMVINSGSVSLSAIQNWSGLDYTLAASIGFLHDEVSGRLFARHHINTGDFPFLSDPSFNTYGGTIPIGSLKFTARPHLNTTYMVNYEHGIVEDLDARLEQFQHDTLSLGIAYQATDQTLFSLQLDTAFISDGNYRFHAMTDGHYNLWTDAAMLDYQGRRQGRFSQSEPSFLRIGYELNYFSDNHTARDEKYETFVHSEYRYKGMITGQAEVMTFGLNEQLLLNLNLAYGAGRTQRFSREANARLFYYKPDSSNEFGLRYGYEDEESTNQPQDNQLIGGRTTSHAVSLYTKWGF
jgi:tetratricopeptide (TPR) repeat protein